MSKILNYMKKHDNLTMLIAIIIITSLAGNFVFSFYDDLYVFGNIYKLCNGQVIYRDVNILITPIFYLICKFILNIFAKNYITFKIINIFIGTGIYFIIYNIQKELKISKCYSIFNTAIIIIFSYNSILYLANYNTLALLFMLIGILYTIKNYYNRSKYYNLIQSIFVALTVLTDQKIGVGYIIGYILSERKIKKITKTAFFSAIWGIIFLLIEFTNNNLNYFLDMCIQNVSSFSNNLIIEVKAVLYIIAIIIIFIMTVFYLLYMKIEKNIKNQKTENVKILFSFSVGSLTIIYPILNEYHLMITFIIWMMLAFYLAYIVLNELLQNKNIKITIISVAIILITLITTINLVNTINYIKHANNDKNSFYYGIYIKEDDKEQINTITKYIKEQQESNKNIKIVSPLAMLYTIPLNINNWYFDLPLTGNLGKEDYEVLINAIKNEPEGTIFLIENDKSKYTCYQTSKQTIDYIKSNYKKIGDIEYFDVYEK